MSMCDSRFQDLEGLSTAALLVNHTRINTSPLIKQELNSIDTAILRRMVQGCIFLIHNISVRVHASFKQKPKNLDSMVPHGLNNRRGIIRPLNLAIDWNRETVRETSLTPSPPFAAASLINCSAAVPVTVIPYVCHVTRTGRARLPTSYPWHFLTYEENTCSTFGWPRANALCRGD